ncbi:Maf-like protein [Breoghania sp. L-A4]|uniref:Maf-like protein n=1 Tax=Breoghania sp. L-A4 TaxID=2304600 RepID=UPI000E35A0F7|nr:Maf-like protein [Breoghania sp. L-A4]AXS38815.1 Maf-like protein [Breoghania sp. L-A4]
MNKLVLASNSPWRATMLRNAGLEIEADPADIDERAIEAPLRAADLSAEDIAAVLAEAKATEVASRHPGALVLGCDQVLEFEGETHSKPADMEAARRKLLAMRGMTHHLHSALVIVYDNETIWRHTATATLKMRDFSPEFVGHYLAETGEAALTSVGAYQIERRGIQLFEKIDGDYFTIVGLPLLPLLAFLRERGCWKHDAHPRGRHRLADLPFPLAGDSFLLVA